MRFRLEQPVQALVLLRRDRQPEQPVSWQVPERQALHSRLQLQPEESQAWEERQVSVGRAVPA
ncbi:MAG: hypothetical protein JSR62_09475 [Nitrospira sp.]|nr:hypothetical protein [Nitrospira sp.]